MVSQGGEEKCGVGARQEPKRTVAGKGPGRRCRVCADPGRQFARTLKESHNRRGNTWGRKERHQALLVRNPQLKLANTKVATGNEPHTPLSQGRNAVSSEVKNPGGGKETWVNEPGNRSKKTGKGSNLLVRGTRKRGNVILRNPGLGGTRLKKAKAGKRPKKSQTNFKPSRRRERGIGRN